MAKKVSQKLKTAKELLGKKIKKLRNELDLSQQELADKVYVTATHIGHIEQGVRSPSFKLLEKIARALKIPLQELFASKKH